MNATSDKGFLRYQVGGAVRDALLGVPVQDRDWVVVGQSAENMLAMGFRQVGADFPVFLHPTSHEEYALARTELKTGPGYRGFAVSSAENVSLEEDLLRRDLTINAMAMDEKGNLIDLFGGKEDLQQRLLRHVSAAFSEDPLRVLRVARFMAQFSRFGFKIAPETFALMQELANAGAVSELTPERIWMETHKALFSAEPSQFFRVLKSCNALQAVFPELAALIGKAQSPQYHPEGDVWTHTMLTLDAATQLSSDPIIRFAALMHDVGKGATPASLMPRHHGHEEVGARLMPEICQRLRVPKAFCKLATITAGYHLQAHRIREMRPKSIVKLLNNLDSFRNPAILGQFIQVCTADKWGRGPQSLNKPYPQGELLQRCLNSCLSIDNQKLLAAGHQGEGFAKALHKMRIGQVVELLKKA